MSSCIKIFYKIGYKNMQEASTPKPQYKQIKSQVCDAGLQNASNEAKVYKEREAALKMMSVDDYCLFLKQQRVKFKPPLLEQARKAQFCLYFDGILVKKSLEEATIFIRAQRKHKLSEDKADSTPQLHNSHHSESPYSGAHKQSKEVQSLQKPIASSQGQIIDKLLLYTWQLCNIRTIVGSESGSIWAIPQQIINNMHRLCISTSRMYVSGWGLKHVTMQAMQICYFNLLKNGLFDVDPVKNGSLCCLIEAILADTEGSEHQQFVNLDREFELMVVQDEQDPIRKNIKQMVTEKQQHAKISKAKIVKKTSTQLELEWFTYIIQYCISHCQFFVRQTYSQLSNSNIHSPTVSSVSFLHYVSVLLNKVINDRTTTEIVKGYTCPIEDVRQMYSRANGTEEGVGATVDMKISWADYEWILEVLLMDMWKKYKGEIKKVWDRYVHDKQVSSKDYNSHYIYCIMNIISVVNCCNFLGGYNPQLQKKTTKLVMQFGLEFLELSYLIYELCHAKKKNIQVKTYDTIRANFLTNLSAILNSQSTQSKSVRSLQKNNEFAIQLIEVEEPAMKVDQCLENVLPLEQGQLVSIIRMLSNLVHINEVAQKYFEENIKYFRIIMSLTHEFESQLTMKNWAIVFLRNVAERSAIMRAELEKLQIDVKVDNGSSPFI